MSSFDLGKSIQLAMNHSLELAIISIVPHPLICSYSPASFSVISDQSCSLFTNKPLAHPSLNKAGQGVTEGSLLIKLYTNSKN